jgi:ABC-type transport system involved in multi-copper enzyme maturation permease subunit
MAGLLNIARWEGFKLRHRRMPWVLFAVLLGFTQLAVWGGFLSYKTSVDGGGFVQLPAEFMNSAPGVRRGYFRCDELRTRPTAVLPAFVPPQAIPTLLALCERQLSIRYNLLLPTGSASAAMGVAGTIGMVLLGILAATAFGGEYGLGTLRPILVRGVGRLPYLGGKLLVLVGCATVALLLAAAAAALSGLLISKMVAPPPDFSASGSWHAVVMSFVRVWAAMTAFLAMAASVTVLTRSTAAGMAVTLGCYLFEGLFIRLMSTAFSWFDRVGDYLPMHNLTALVRTTSNLGGPPGLTGEGIGTWQASIVVALYVIASGVAAAVVFRSRDIGGTSGG